MKILFLSLLRAGDFIMQVPLIKSAAKGQEIHVLVNDEFLQLANLYPEFQFHFFPRKALQNLINQQETSLLAPYSQLRSFIEKMNLEKFTSLYNLTHNRISAYLMEQLRAPEKKGLLFSGHQFQAFENSWQEFFNKTFSENIRSNYHYLTVLSRSLGLELPLVKTAEKRNSKKIYFQCFTSDMKKNWPVQKWVDLFKRTQHMRPDYSIEIICTAEEKKQLLPFVEESALQVCDLQTAKALIAEAEILVSCDTSLAHLAAETRTPVVVISLGSSDYTKTMPWLQGTWVVSSQTECGPCKHSSACPFTETLCAEQLRVSTVLSVIKAQLEDRYFLSIAEPEKVLRMEWTMSQGPQPMDVSLSRRTDGFNEQQNTELF